MSDPTPPAPGPVCIDLSLTIPTIPDLLLPSAALLLTIPPFDLPCCKFKIAIPALDQAIAATNAALAAGIATLGAPFIVTIAAANKVIALAQKQVNKVRIRIPTCPCDGQTVTL